MITINSGKNYFYNCFHGISIIGNYDSQCFINNAVFRTIDSHLRYPFQDRTQGEAGIAIANAVSTGPNYPHPGYIDVYQSDFRNLRYGVNSYNSDNFSYEKCNFLNCQIGISNRNTNMQLSGNTIIQCNFDCNYTAAECDNMAVHITENTVNSDAYSSELVSSGFVVGSSFFNINRNDISNVTIGIMLDNNQTTNNASWLSGYIAREIALNPMFNLVYSNRIKNVSEGMNIRRDNNTVQLRCNEFRCYDDFGIHLIPSTTSSVVLDDQGDLTTGEYPGNQFFCFNNGTATPLNSTIIEFDDIADFKYYINGSDAFPPGTSSVSNSVILSLQPLGQTNNDYCGDHSPDPSFIADPSSCGNNIEPVLHNEGGSGVVNNHTLFTSEQNRSQSSFSVKRIEDNQDTKETMFKLFPSPANNELNIHCDLEEELLWSVYTLQGDLVYQTKLKGHKQTIVDIEHLNTGLYLYTLSKEGQEFIRDKFIVIK